MNPVHRGLTAGQLEGMAKLVGLTRDVEFNCGECLDHVSEFAERQIAGESLDDTLERVEHHLALCPECREEWLALRKILEAGR